MRRSLALLRDKPKPHIFKRGGRWHVHYPNGDVATSCGFGRHGAAFALAAYIRHPWFAR